MEQDPKRFHDPCSPKSPPPAEGRQWTKQATISRGTVPPTPVPKKRNRFGSAGNGNQCWFTHYPWESLVSSWTSFSIAKEQWKKFTSPWYFTPLSEATSNLDFQSTSRPWIWKLNLEKKMINLPDVSLTTLWFLEDSGVLNRSTFSRKLQEPGPGDPNIAPPTPQGSKIETHLTHVTLDHFGRRLGPPNLRVTRNKNSPGTWLLWQGFLQLLGPCTRQLGPHGLHV